MDAKGILKDFDLLIQHDAIGCYNSCEVTEIVILKEEKAYNIYTLMCFEYSNMILDDFHYLSQKNWSIPCLDGHLAIKQGRVSLKNARIIVGKILNDGRLLVDGDETVLGELEMQGKAYVPADNNVALNHILKNNFLGGSYIIEAFDIPKKNLEYIIKQPSLLNELGEFITEKIPPFEIASVSDRIGNVILQFPVNLLNASYKYSDGGGIDIHICYNPRYKANNVNFICSATAIEDGLQYDYSSISFNERSQDIHISVDTDKTTECRIYNGTYDLILSSSKLDYMNKFVFNIKIESHQNRVFRVNDKLIETPVCDIEKMTCGTSKGKKTIVEWENNRIYEQQRATLEKELKFKQFFNGMRQEALDFIRKLIYEHSDCGIYLWDAYASAKDIKETLYYVPYYNVPVRVITTLENNNEDKELNISFDKEEDLSDDDPKYTMINLEVRTTRGESGKKFHDRFLIFPQQNPEVWSLGTSINGLGKSHHIIMEVQNAQHICNAFNIMWEELKDEEYIIWPNRKK